MKRFFTKVLKAALVVAACCMVGLVLVKIGYATGVIWKIPAGNPYAHGFHWVADPALLK